MNNYHEIPWPDDEHAPPPSVMKTYFRTWKGMPLRNDWNASPMRMYQRQCTRCGYKWDQVDFEYRDGSYTNGTPNPVAIHKVCWHCWMADTNHAQVRAYWESVDRNNTTTVPKKQIKTSLKPMGSL